MEPETQKLITVLQTATKVLGIPLREVERRMGLSTGYLSRVLSGKVELRVDHICAIARAMELEPAEIFRAAFPLDATPPSAAALKIRGAVTSFASPEAVTPGGPVPMGDPDQVEQLLEKTLRRLFRELGKGAD
jgi:transcriptional regulator with XRE-family HTH domain